MPRGMPGDYVKKSRASVRMWMHETVILTKARRRKHDGRNGTAHGRRAGVRWPPCTPIKERIWRTLREPRSGGTHNRTDYLYSVVDVILTVPRRRKHDGVFPSSAQWTPHSREKLKLREPCKEQGTNSRADNLYNTV